MKNTSIPSGVQGVISATLHTSNGDISLAQDDFVSGSPSFKFGTSEGNTISIGSAVIGDFSCGLMNESGKFKGVSWKGASIDVYITVNNTQLNMGTYYINKRTESGKKISLTFYDAMEMFDEHKMTENTWTDTTASSLLSSIAEKRLGKNHFTNNLSRTANIEIPEKLDNMTERAAISYLAQLLGGYAIIRGGNLVIDWYNTDNPYYAGTTFSHSFQLDDVSVSGVSVTSDDGETTATRGDTSGSYVIDISDNKLITSANADNVAGNIWSAVGNLSFRAGTFSIQCNPAIEAGDCLQIDTGEEDGIITLATTVTYKTSSLQESITADAKDSDTDARMSTDDYIKELKGEGGGNYPDAESVYW